MTGTGFIYFWVQIFTAGILFMAANTGFQDFPRLSHFLARDNYLPRWFQNRGDRLVYSSGIAALTLLSAMMLIIFQADEIRMLPLYALGVMMAFSLSQSGMFRLMGKIAHLKPGETIKTNVTTIHYEKGVRWKRVHQCRWRGCHISLFSWFFFSRNSWKAHGSSPSSSRW